jgi:TRAP-type C4-dicarboxylate transport system permease small subunit
MKETILRASATALYLACIWMAGLSIFVMSLIIPWGIFTRYVLGTGSQWPEPIAILLMVVFTFLGAAVAYRAGGHIAVAMLTDRLPAHAAPVLPAVVHLLHAGGGDVHGGTAPAVHRTWNQSIGEIPWMPVGATYMPVPLGGSVTLPVRAGAHGVWLQHRRAVVTFDHEAGRREAA